MKKLKTLIIVSTLALSSIASLPLTADTNTHMQEVEKLFKLTQMDKKIDESVDSILQMQLHQNPELSTHSAELRNFFAKYIGWSALKDDLVNMYMQTFTEEELKAANEFYITPAGQKIINAIPALVEKRNELAMQRLQNNIGELQQIVGTQKQNP